MTLGTGIYLVLIAGILLVALAGLIRIINTNFNTGQRLRDTLLERVKLLRLGRMLKKRNISAKNYLHETVIHEIEAHIRNCESCENVKECESALAEPASENKDMSFCPNDNALKRYSKVHE